MSIYRHRCRNEHLLPVRLTVCLCCVKVINTGDLAGEEGEKERREKAGCKGVQR